MSTLSEKTYRPQSFGTSTYRLSTFETPPPSSAPLGAEFVRSWYLRCKDLMDRYDPDLVYFDDTELPLGQVGLDITADFYNSNMRRHGGRLAHDPVPPRRLSFPEMNP